MSGLFLEERKSPSEPYLSSSFLVKKTMLPLLFTSFFLKLSSYLSVMALPSLFSKAFSRLSVLQEMTQ